MLSLPCARIDLGALRHNFQQLKIRTPHSRTMSVVKANAYGHGAIEVAKVLSQSDAFAVARTTEAILLRQAGINQPIVLLEGVTTQEELQLASDFSLSPVFHHASQLSLLNSTILSKPLEFCWLKVDSGMHRLGFSIQESISAWQQLENSSSIAGSVGLMTHLANADQPVDNYNQYQWQQFEEVSQSLDVQRSMANSAAILSAPDFHVDWVRPGLMLYGVSPFAESTAAEFGLKPVMQLQAELIAIHHLQMGDKVGYGGEWTCPEPMKVGVVAIGYADGYSRHLSSTGSVIVHGQLVPILGRVSMDMIAVDLRHIEEASPGDNVILWGDELLTVESVARQAGTIPYELLCAVSDRVHRDYG